MSSAAVMQKRRLERDRMASLSRYREEKKIQRNPENRIAQEWHNNIENRIVPIAVYFSKQVMIPLYNFLPEST